MAGSNKIRKKGADGSLSMTPLAVVVGISPFFGIFLPSHYQVEPSQERQTNNNGMVRESLSFLHLPVLFISTYRKIEVSPEHGLLNFVMLLGRTVINLATQCGNWFN